MPSFEDKLFDSVMDALAPLDAKFLCEWARPAGAFGPIGSIRTRLPALSSLSKPLACSSASSPLSAWPSPRASLVYGSDSNGERTGSSLSSIISPTTPGFWSDNGECSSLDVKMVS